MRIELARQHQPAEDNAFRLGSQQHARWVQMHLLTIAQHAEPTIILAMCGIEEHAAEDSLSEAFVVSASVVCLDVLLHTLCLAPGKNMLAAHTCRYVLLHARSMIWHHAYES